MKALVRLVCLCVAASLSACGGGGGGAPDVPATPVQCTLGLGYVNSQQSSGIAIPESQDWQWAANEPKREFSPACEISRMTQIQVGLCLNHPKIQDLRVQLVAPDKSTVSLTLPASASGNACLEAGSNNRLFTMTLDGTALSNRYPSNGPWLVQVRDFSDPSSAGHLIGWSLQLVGVK